MFRRKIQKFKNCYLQPFCSSQNKWSLSIKLDPLGNKTPSKNTSKMSEFLQCHFNNQETLQVSLNTFCFIN